MWFFKKPRFFIQDYGLVGLPDAGSELKIIRTSLNQTVSGGHEPVPALISAYRFALNFARMTQKPPLKAQCLLIVTGQRDLDTLKPAEELFKTFNVTVYRQNWPSKGSERARLAELNIPTLVAATESSSLPKRVSFHFRRPVWGVTAMPPTTLATAKTLTRLFASVETGNVGVLAVGEAGARNAALAIISALALSDPRLDRAYQVFRQQQTQKVLKSKLP